MVISLTLAHKSTKAVALNKLQEKAQQLVSETFPGVQIINPGTKLQDNKLSFWFTAKSDKGTMMVTGIIEVTETDVVLSLTLPDIVSKIPGFSEQLVKTMLTQKFHELFA